MKIRINKFCFYVPLSQRIAKLLLKKSNADYVQVLEPILSTLKEYKKENGHFNIVELEDKDGNRLVITI